MSDKPPVDKSPPSADPRDIKSVSNGLNAFTLALYKATPKKGNTVLSPFSVGTALSLVELGAKGESAKALHTLLGAEASDSHRTGLRALTHTLKGGGPPGEKYGEEIQPHVLDLSNSLWLAKGHDIVPTFRTEANDYYHASASSFDVSNPTEAAQQVNAWVSDATNKKIEEIITPASITALTRLILVNAVHFVGRWQEPFEVRNTVDTAFYVNGRQKSVDVPTMRGGHRFDALDTEELMIVDLPYWAARDDVQIVMTVLVPKKRDGLGDLEEKLSPEVLASWLGEMTNQMVEVALPRWKAATTAELTEVLPAMGIEELFSDKAELSGISDEKGLHLSGVLHKAFINVDEKGTEAAAATAIVLMGSAAPPKLLKFAADRPFLYLIRDKKTGTILFIGRVLDPR